MESGEILIDTIVKPTTIPHPSAPMVDAALPATS
jgi:hypothetical protein